MKEILAIMITIIMIFITAPAPAAADEPIGEKRILRLVWEWEQIVNLVEILNESISVRDSSQETARNLSLGLLSRAHEIAQESDRVGGLRYYGEVLRKPVSVFYRRTAPISEEGLEELIEEIHGILNILEDAIRDPF